MSQAGKAVAQAVRSAASMPSQPAAGDHRIESDGFELGRRFGGSLGATGAAGCISSSLFFSSLLFSSLVTLLSR
jgi:hypothetical protein